MHIRSWYVAAAIAAAIGASAIGLSVSTADSGARSVGSPAPVGTDAGAAQDPAASYPTSTPIKHVVVIYGENVSFDHYFGTYPTALNPPGEPRFVPLPDTPAVNGLSTALLDANPNLYNPQRLDPSQALTCDQDHGYTAEQSAFDMGLMDRFVQETTGGGCGQSGTPDSGGYGPPGIVMDYYDGNTVTALWNYAQHFVLEDNQYGTGFGPSTPGALNVISGQTHGASAVGGSTPVIANGTDISDIDPAYDLCSNPNAPSHAGTLPGNPSVPGDTVPEPNGVTMQMTGPNIGNLLNAKGITWGWFEGGFAPTGRTSSGFPICDQQAHANIGGALVTDYIPHHEPFQYYESTSNPYHNPPASVDDVGVSDPPGTPLSQAVNHQYDLSWFNATLTNGNMPAVSYLKAPAYEDGHAGYSDPLDEQRFLVDEINRIEESRFWPTTAIFIDYDDSDGWYDHQMGPIIRQSADVLDTLTGPGHCGSPNTSAPGFQNDRCGVGPRIPLLVISPWAKTNYVDSTFTEQASIVRFIEDNWGLGRLGNGSADATAGTLDNAFDFDQRYGHAPAVILNDTTGEVERVIPASPAGQQGSQGQGPAAGGTSSGGDTGGSDDAAAGSQGGSGASQAGSGASQVGSGASQVGSGASQGGSGASRHASGGAETGGPRLICRSALRADAIVLHCTVTSGHGAMALRARLYRGRVLIANRALRVHGRRGRLSLRLGRHRSAGRYTIRLSIDAAGSVRMLTLERMIR